MKPTESSIAAEAAASELRRGELHGDRLIAGLWIAMFLAVARALLQLVVDQTAEKETGETLAAHFLEHLVAASSRVWIVVPALAIFPRGRHRTTAWLRALLAFGFGVALLSGWPDGELRYQPGFDSVRGLQGWAAIGLLAIAVAALDRYATAPHPRMLGWTSGVRFMVTAAVLLVGTGVLATLSYAIDRARLNLEVKSIVFDLLDELPRAVVTTGVDGQKVELGSILADKGVEPAGAGGNKPSLIVPVGAWAEFEVQVPPHTMLTFSFAVDRNTIRAKAPDHELKFVVAVDGVEKLADPIRPQTRTADRGWQEREVQLSFREEQRVKVRLSVRGEGPDLGKVRAGFGRPLLVRRQWRARVPTDPGRMNVVLVVVDSLRPDHLGCYGYGRPTSPQIDGLAAESIVYENAQAPSSWTWPSVASIFTGCWPPTHGVEDRDRCFLSDSLETLAEQFSNRSCTTFGVTANPLVSHTKNFNQGFEELIEKPLDAAPVIGGKFREFLRRFGGYQFFAYVHFTDPHRPYNPPERFATQFTSAENATLMRHKVNEIRALRATSDDPARAKPATESEADALPDLPPEAIVGLYDGEIACVDFEIGRMIRALEDERLLDRTVFVVTGAHGEVIGAGPAATAGSSLARDLLHVPLVIRDPRQQPRREKGVVDLTLLAPTLAHAAFADPRASAAAGTPRNDGGPATIPAPAPMMAPWSERPPGSAFAHTARGIVEGKSGPCELVALTKDSGRITMTADGQVLEFVDLRQDASSGAPGAPGSDALRDGLGKELGRWLAECRRRAVSRPFERMDYTTQTTLRQMGDD